MGDTTRWIEQCITHGPWGGSKGEKWTYMPEGFIKKITIRYGEVIGCITLESDSNTGKSQSSCFGTGKWPKYYSSASICIQYPNEFLTSISGMSGTFEGSKIVLSLVIQTNRRCYGPYGNGVATADTSRFSYDGKGGMIVGLHGRSSIYIDAIGIYTMPKSMALYLKSTCEDNSIHKLFLIGMPREAGPWGASEGKLWDDGVFSNIKQVRVHLKKSVNVIIAVQFEYVKKDSTSILSPMHGGPCEDDKVEVANLAVASEYLTGISGFYGPIEGHDGLKGITSVTFHTNIRMYGPYGKEGGGGCVYFTSTASPGKVIGSMAGKVTF